MSRHTSLSYVALFISLSFSLAAQATDYYVAKNGNDGNSGRTPDQAFQTLSRALGALGDGDSVYLRAGDKWTPSKAQIISRSGSSSNPLTLGAFEVGADGRVSHRVNDRRPVLDGQTTVPSRGSWLGLITVRGRNVRVQDIELRNSGGVGLVFEDTSNGVADNVKTQWTYFNGILANRSDAITVRDSDVSGFGRGGREFGEPVYPSGVSVASGEGFVVTGSYIHEGWGEGISGFRGSSDIRIEDNRVFAVRNVGIYLDAARDARITGNMILGTNNSAYYRGSRFVGPGIALGNESYQYQGYGGSLSTDFITENIDIYNNLVSGTSSGLALFGELPGAAFNNIRVLHNSFVDNGAQFRSYGFPLTNVTFANNMFLSISSDAKDVSPGDFDPAASYAVEFRSNYWSEGRPDSRLRSSSDVYGEVTLRRSGGWRQISDGRSVSWQDFQPVGDSVTIDAGDRTYLTRVPMDFNDTPHGDAPDIGALTANGPTQIARRPRSPTAVRILFQ